MELNPPILAFSLDWDLVLRGPVEAVYEAELTEEMLHRLRGLLP